MFNDLFFNDDDKIAIPLAKYVHRFDINMLQRGIIVKGRSFADVKTFVVDKVIESEERLSFIHARDTLLIYGTVFAHRIFFDWLLTQKME